MKKLIMIGGTMGVGKTTLSKVLQQILPDNVFLDGDWCWDMRPFVVNEETKAMVQDHITHLLSGFIRCSAFEYVIFCWVMHEQSIIDDILAGLPLADCTVYQFSLVCTEEALIQRLQTDITAGRRTVDVIDRSVARLGLYQQLATEKIDVSQITAIQAADIIWKCVVGGEYS